MDKEDFMEVTVIEEKKPEPSERRKALVSDLTARIKSAKAFHEKPFKQMFKDMDAALKGFDDAEWNDTNYVANILQRHVQQRTAALYAKNPQAVATRRDRMDYAVWDGEETSLAMAYQASQTASQAALPVPFEAQAIIQDYMAGQNHRKMLDNVAKTLEQLFDYFMNEQTPSFKSQMKGLVRRVITCGVGYVKVGFQRDMDRMPEVAAQIADVQGQIDYIQRIAKGAAKGEINQDDPQIEELMLSLKALTEEPMMIVREGLLFDFPEASSIIIDPMCRQLRGFVGANWIAHEMYLSPNDVEEIYGVDIKDKFNSYDVKGRLMSDGQYERKAYGEIDINKTQREGLVLVYEYYDQKSGLQYCLADGYEDFLREPMAPDVKVESFFPIFPLVFNEIEHKDVLFPPSDIKLLMPMQNEYNRARQGLREHRRANRPKYAAPAGMLEDADKEKLATHPANAVIELQALASGQKVNDVIQPVQQIGIDPNLYEVRTIFDDVQLVVGAQEANFGGVSKATATETSIAESSRMSSLGANIDDLDSFMSEVARAAGQIMLYEMSSDEVKKIVGRGAAWPEMTREEIMEEVFLEIEAGSTGKPNRAAELQNIERIMPFLLQIPGIDPSWLAKELLKRLDDKLDITQAIVDKIPSIVAMNQSQGEGTGNPALAGAPSGGASNAPMLNAQSAGSLPPMGNNQ
jgi:archaellum component FlaC